MKLLHDKVSPLIDSQFPSFYREEGPLFVEFVRSYYEWLEQSGNPLYHSRHLLDYADIDSTLDSFLPYYQTKYLPGTPTTNIVSRRELIKHSSDIYRTRGTIQSLQLAFRMLYNEDVQVYYPGDDILKPSDGKWVTPRHIEVTVSDRTKTFVGRDVTGVTSGAKGFVERVDRRQANGRTVDIISLSNVKPNEITGQTFTAGELITNDGIHDGCPIVLGSMSSIVITSQGTGFVVGQIIDVISQRTGKSAKARVTSVGALTGKIEYQLIDGGFGYTLNASLFPGDETKVIISSNVISTALFSSSNVAVASFADQPSITQPITSIEYGANTFAPSAGQLIFGANSTAGIIATGIVLQANATANQIIVSPRTTSRLTIDTVVLPSTVTGSYSIGELVYQQVAGSNSAVGMVMQANSTTVVIDQYYGPFTSNASVYGVDSLCTSNTATVTTYDYSDTNFVDGSLSYVYVSGNTSANATSLTATRLNVSATVIGANTLAVGINDITVGGTFAFNANTGVDEDNEYILTTTPHKFANGDSVVYIANTGNTAIGGLSNGSTYYVINTSNTTHLQLSSSYGGSAIDLTAGTVSETGHTLTSPTKRVYTGSYAYVFSTACTDIRAEAAVISTGYPGAFQIGQITNIETIYIDKSLLSQSNTSGSPVLGVALNATAYGLTNVPSANLSSVIGVAVNNEQYQIGSVLSLTNKNPGNDNTSTPFLKITEAGIAALEKPGRNYLTLLSGSTSGTFRIGERVTQTVTEPIVVITYSTLNGTFSTSTKELVYQTRSDGNTVYGQIYNVDTVNSKLYILVANTSNTFNTTNTVVSVVNNSVNASVSSTLASSLSVVSKGEIIDITTLPGTVVPTQLHVKQLSLRNFVTGANVVGVETGSYGSVAGIGGDYTYGVIGDNAIVNPSSDITQGTLQSVEVSATGYFYDNGETVTLSYPGNPNTGEGVIRVDSVGFAEGYWRGEDGVLSSTKKIQDNEYYQEYSYEIQSGVDRTVYEPAVKSLTHVAGTKMFSKYNKAFLTETPVTVAYAVDSTTSSYAATFTLDAPWVPHSDDTSFTYAPIISYVDPDVTKTEGWPRQYPQTIAPTANAVISHPRLASNTVYDVNAGGALYSYGGLVDANTTNQEQKNHNYYMYWGERPFVVGAGNRMLSSMAGYYQGGGTIPTGGYQGQGVVYCKTYGSGGTTTVVEIQDPDYDNGGLFHKFGWCLGLNATGEYAYISAPGYNSSVGQIYVIRLADQSLIQTVVNPFSGTLTLFGSSFTVNSKYLIVSMVGAVCFYQIETDGTLTHIRNVTDNIYVQDLDNRHPGYIAYDANNDDRVAICRYPGYTSSTSIKIYDIPTGDVEHTISIPLEYRTPDAGKSGFGWNMVFNDDTMYISSPALVSNTYSDSSGRVYKYTISTSTFTEWFHCDQLRDYFILATAMPEYGITGLDCKRPAVGTYMAADWDRQILAIKSSGGWNVWTSNSAANTAVQIKESSTVTLVDMATQEIITSFTGSHPAAKVGGYDNYSDRVPIYWNSDGRLWFPVGTPTTEYSTIWPATPLYAGHLISFPDKETSTTLTLKDSSNTTIDQYSLLQSNAINSSLSVEYTTQQNTAAFASVYVGNTSYGNIASTTSTTKLILQ